VQREHVADGGLRLQPDEDVVAEEHQPADRHDVARHAVVFRADPLGADQPHLRAAEHFQAARVERLRPAGQLRRPVGQPAPQDLVRADVERR
jgi:hypothetical protein